MKKLLKTKGAALVEYVVLIGGMAALGIVAVNNFGGLVRDTFEIADVGIPEGLDDNRPESEAPLSFCDAGDYGGEIGVPCDPFLELVDACDLASLAILEFCPGTGVTYIGDDLPGEPGRTYTIVPDVPDALYPAGWLPDPELAWDTDKTDYGNFYPESRLKPLTSVRGCKATGG